MIDRPSSIAPLKNVSRMMTMISKLQDRGPGSPSFGVFSGFSGYGKSQAAMFALNTHAPSAVYLEVGPTWTKKEFLKKLLEELAETNLKGTATDLLDRAIMLLAGDPDQVLLIDEADRVVERGIIEIVRELHDKLQVPVVLIGEEKLPQKLGAQQFERVHNRVLDWAYAQPCDLDDALVLKKALVPKLDITPELVTEIVQRTKGNARRIATTFFQVEAFAANSSAQQMSPSTYDGMIMTGEIPTRYRKRAA